MPGIVSGAPYSQCEPLSFPSCAGWDGEGGGEGIQQAFSIHGPMSTDSPPIENTRGKTTEAVSSMHRPISLSLFPKQ